MYNVFRIDAILGIINTFMYKLRLIKSAYLSTEKWNGRCVVFCVSWVICHWSCWRQCWWGRSWCCIWVTLSLMTTAVDTSLASPGVLNGERLLCWPRSARRGVTLWLVGQSRQLLSGSDISSRSWLNVSIHTHKHTLLLVALQLHACTRFVVTYITCI